MSNEKQHFFKKLWAKYNDLCKDLGVEQGACRGCVPVVKFDPEAKKAEKDDKTTKSDK